MQPRSRWLSDRLSAPGSAALARRPRLLVLCDYETNNAATIIDHIEAIREWSTSDVYILPMLRDLPADLDLDAFDGLVIHYNLVMAFDSYISPLARWRIHEFRGVKAAFIQDEYRFVNDTVGAMRTLGIEVLFTCVPEDQVRLVYDPAALPDLRQFVTVLTGYVPERLLARPVVAYDGRPIDVGYRARRLRPWLGNLGREKAQIADRFAAEAPHHRLAVDISCREEDRLYGDAWLDFVSHSKAMLGAESGASVFDFDGSVETRIRAHLRSHPDASYDNLHRMFMAAVDGQIRLNQISPRCFEAAALGTLMVLYPGEYSGILKAWRHFVPLDKDHGNMAEVVAALRDRATWERITAQARAEVALDPKYSFRAVAKVLDEALALPIQATNSLDARTFEAIATRSLAAIGRLRPGLEGGGRRLLRVAGQVRGLLRPSPVAIAVAQGRGPGARGKARSVLHGARSAVYWALQPNRIPPQVLAARGMELVAELGQLSLLQAMGAAAVATRVPSPFVLVLDRAAETIRIALRPEAGADLQGTSTFPDDLSWVRTIRLDLGDRWLVPVGIRDPLATLEILSSLVRSRPSAVGRLLIGPPRWCAVSERDLPGESRQPVDYPSPR